ncbi:MAG: hypothetical protein ABJQ90_18825 [Parasphingorhabdus sp.]
MIAGPLDDIFVGEINNFHISGLLGPNVLEKMLTGLDDSVAGETPVVV